ncbi:MFS general substrate transporter [Tuber magnatum]|uniref:MFS general substrate transporter n=1 Tax=Tuber magnatum TaxID=42249 RepID=A0A317SXR4_9PEZI|nr:MFS general substrate transporter [Tuber magnatum]
MDSSIQDPLVGSEAEAQAILGGNPSPKRTPDSQGYQREGAGASETSPSGVPWYRKPSVSWLLPPFCLFTMAFGGVTVPRLNVILALICQQHYRDNGYTGNSILPVLMGGDSDKQCNEPEVQALVSKFTLYMSLVAGILSAFTAPRLGSLSDRYGRRLAMAFSSFGLLASEITTILAAKYPDLFNVNILLFGSLIDGICGSFMLGMALSYSYGADCTSPSRRAVAFGYFQGCLFLGIATGPVLGGLLVKKTNNILSVFYLALGAHAVFISYVMFLMPESLSKRRMVLAREKHKREQMELQEGAPKHWWNSFNPINLLRPLIVLSPTGQGSSAKLRLNLMLLAATDCVLFGVGIGSITVILIYAEAKFDWGNFESSIYVSIVNCFRVTMLFVVLPLVVTFFRRGSTTQNLHRGCDTLDINLIRFSIATETAGYLCYALAQSGGQFTTAGVLTALGGIGSPTLQSSLTKHIPTDKTGKLLGATALLHSLARVVAPTVFNLIYASTVATYPQTVFVCLSSTFGIAAVCSLFLAPGVFWNDADGGDGEEGTWEEQAPLLSSE